jgi:predicted amino acid dehydrogenase
MSNLGTAIKDDSCVPTISQKAFPLSDIGTAFKLVQSGNSHGKVVIIPQPKDQVKAIPSFKASQILSADATYVLIGGTGGLGRSIAKWMVSKGARHLVLVSRSGSTTGKVQSLIDDVAAVGAKVFVKNCDVADKDAVEKLISKELSGMPEIKGVVHGAMVLNVSQNSRHLINH